MYTIKRSNGTSIQIQDGDIDASTDLKLVGKNVSGFGESINQNFVRLLENFSSDSSPSNPLSGQLWYNTSDGRLSVYDGNGWKSANGTIVAQDQPLNLTTGDVWIDSRTKKLFFHDGTGLYEAAKQWEDAQNKTGTIAETILDNSTPSKPKNILSLYVNGQHVGIYSADKFRIKRNLNNESTVLGFDYIEKGFNSNSTMPFAFDVVATNSLKLNSLQSSDFLRRNFIDSTNQKITFQTDDGITVGDRQIGDLKANGYILILENTATDGDIVIKSNTNAVTSNAVYIKASTKKIGIYNSNPTHTLDITGDLAVSGAVIASGIEINGTTISSTDSSSIVVHQETTFNSDVTVEHNMSVSGTFMVARVNTAARNGLTATDGSIIYNTTTNKFQGKANGIWVDLH